MITITTSSSSSVKPAPLIVRCIEVLPCVGAEEEGRRTALPASFVACIVMDCLVSRVRRVVPGVARRGGRERGPHLHVIHPLVDRVGAAAVELVDHDPV